MSSPKMDSDFSSLAKYPRPSWESAQALRDAMQEARAKEASPILGLEVEVEDLNIAKPGQEELLIRIYRKKSLIGCLPVLLYAHGGGFFCGDLSSEEWQCVQYAMQAECVVVCVAYKLAPENPFPAGLQDVYAVLQYLWDNSSSLEIDPTKIALAGSSAGANLAAAVVLFARDQKGPSICFQMLLVPVLDDRLTTPSARIFTDVPDFARPEAEIMWQWYLGGTKKEVSCYAAPARATDLASLPSTYILCAGLDPLRDEGMEYARRLVEAGVQVELHLVPAIPHGFASVRAASISKRLLLEQVDVLRRAFSA